MILQKSYAQNNIDTLYVFVGKKISIRELKPPKNLDSSIIISYENYEARYKIMQNICGNFKGNVIEFGVNDHFGVPAFSKSEYALLFVYQHNGKLHHVRYQYFDVYKTKSGRWASCGDPFYFDEKFRDSVKTSITAIKLEFPKPVTFKIRAYDSITVKEVFPEPYFSVNGNIATGIMGCYVEDLFIIKREGILKQLGYFK